MRRGWAPIFLAVLAATIYLGTAAKPALMDEADCGHAIAAREVRETGDWVVMYINGVRWIEKPPMLFWLGAASYAALGESAFSTRLPVALAAIFLVLLIYMFGRRWFGERGGFYAALVICTAFGTFLFTRTMIAESLYALEFTAIFYLFLRAWEGSLAVRPAWWGAAAITALAALTRGLIGVIFPVAAIGLFVLLTGGWRRWRELPLISSAIVFFAIAAPWHIVAGRRVPGFYWFYFINEHFLRAVNLHTTLDYTAVPRFTWWAEHLVWFLPWTFFSWYGLKELPHPAVWGTRSPKFEGGEDLRRYVEPRLLLFLWAGFILLFFTIVTRLEYYSFGAWPAIALLIGAGLSRAEFERRKFVVWMQVALAICAAIFAAAAGFLLWRTRGVQNPADISSVLNSRTQDAYRHAMSVMGDISMQTFAALRSEVIAAAAILFVGFGLAWVLRRRGKPLAATLATALTAAGFLFAADAAFVAFEPYLSSRVLAEDISQHFQPGDRILLYGDFYGGCTVSFYTHQKLWIWNGRYYGLEFGSHFPDAPQIFLDDADFPAFWSGPERVFLVVPESHRAEALARVPRDAAYLLAESGGKIVLVNQPISVGQRPIGDSLSNLLTRDVGANQRDREPAPGA
jgi:4-amino-4-deoxy-L-arabinose transferase-like glycosyltransferase